VCKLFIIFRFIEVRYLLDKYMLNFLKYLNCLGWPPSKSKVQSTVSKNSILNYPHIRHKIYDICKNPLTIKYLPK